MKTTGILLAALLAASLPAHAGDGHDHGEAPAAATGVVLPAVTAVSEGFELVGRLGGGELSILIDRIDSNEPVLGARLSVELDGRTVEAPFHADHGDYSMTDASLLALLEKPGVKALTFTLISGDESDLLTGEMDIHDEPAAAGHVANWRDYALQGAAVALAILLAVVGLRRFGAARNARQGGAA